MVALSSCRKTAMASITLKNIPDDLYDLLRLHIEQAPPPPRSLRPDMPQPFEHVILRALAKDPDDRYQDAGEMAEDLDRARRQSSERTLTLETAAVPRPASRRRWPLTVFVILAARSKLVAGGSVHLVINEDKVGFPAVHIESDFKRPVKFGDPYDIRVGVVRIGNELIDGGELRATGTVERQVANGAFHAVHAAEAGVLEFRNLAAPRYRRHPASLERTVDHAFDDDRAGRVIGARFGAQTEEFDARRVDVVLLDEPHDRGGGHRVYALVRSPDTETAPDDFANLGPLVVSPVAPILEPHTVRWHVGGEA